MPARIPRKSVLTIAVAMAAFAASGCASAPQQLDDNLVVPGERVGRVEIGMPLARLIEVMGVPRASVPIHGTQATSYSFDGLTVGADDKVYWIIVDDPRYRTVSGVSPGTEHIYARAALGTPACVISASDKTTYDYKDVYVDVDNRTGKVQRLGVQNKTTVCRE